MTDESCEKDERPDEEWPGYSEDGHDFVGPWDGPSEELTEEEKYL